MHFGWAHFIADVGLLAILGHALGRTHACFSRLAFAVMPLFISLCLYVFEPEMQRYAGLSALDLGMLLYLAGRGWQRNWRDSKPTRASCNSLPGNNCCKLSLNWPESRQNPSGN